MMRAPRVDPNAGYLGAQDDRRNANQAALYRGALLAQSEVEMGDHGGVVAPSQDSNPYRFAGAAATQLGNAIRSASAAARRASVYGSDGVSGIGPVANGQQYGQDLDAMRGTRGIGPWADGDTYGRALESRQSSSSTWSPSSWTGDGGWADTNGPSTSAGDVFGNSDALAAFRGLRDLGRPASYSDAAFA